MRKLKKICRIIIIISFFITVFDIPSYAFIFQLPSVVLPGEAQEIQAIGSTVRIKGLTEQVNKLTINGRDSIIEKDGSFEEEIIIPLGETEITIIVEDPNGKTKTYQQKTGSYHFIGGCCHRYFGKFYWVFCISSF